MSNKLQKVLSEIDKVKEKIAVQQTRLRELEQQKTELENMEIVGMVRGNMPLHRIRRNQSNMMEKY